MSDSELKCSNCQKPATRLLVRNELGDSDDRLYACSSSNCTPPGEWASYPIDVQTLAKEFKEKNP